MAREPESQLDSDDPRADVTHLVSYEPGGAIFGRSWLSRYRVLVYPGLEVGRLVAHRRYLDIEEGSKRELGGILVERSTYCLENF